MSRLPGPIAKLWTLLPAPYRSRAVRLLLLMLAAVVLETVGVSLVIPVLALLTQPDLGNRYPFIVPLLDAIGNPGPIPLVLGAMVSLVAFYAFKATFVGVLASRQMAFIYGLQEDLSARLFAGYLRQPYTFHLHRNSAQLIRNLTSRISDITTSLLGGITLLTELQVLLGLAILLLFIEPIGALFVAISLGLAGWGFHRLTRTRVQRWGTQRQSLDNIRLQYLLQGIGGVKDVKLLGREAEFIAQFQSVNHEFCRVERYQTTLHQFPRLVTELLAVTGLAALVGVMIASGRTLDSVLPTVGVFAAAAFRLMPSVNRVIGSLQDIRYLTPAVNTMYDEFQGLAADRPQGDHAPIPFTDAVIVDNLGFRYPGAESPTLQNITLSIPQGRTVGIIGTSGAGKSTLVDLILGLLSPDTGVVRVDGRDIRQNLRGWQDQIGYVPQVIYLTDDTLRRNIAFGVPEAKINDAAVMRALRAAQLESFVAQHPDGVNLTVGERGVRLSGGQRQRIGIARALYHDPQVLVLDEATSSLDLPTEADVMEAVDALHGQKTIIIVAHRISTVEHCDRLFRIELGRLVDQGTTAGVLGGPAADVERIRS